MSSFILGILLYVGSTLLEAVMSGSAKWLASDYSIVQLVFFRSLFAFAPALVFLGWKREINLSTTSPALQLTRGLCMLAAVSLFFLALRYLPLADTEAAFSAMPLFMSLLAVVLLGEKLSIGSASAVAVGLVGALLMLRPTQGLVRLEAIYPLLAAVFAASATTVTRLLAQTDSSTTTLCWGNLVVLAGATAGLPFVWLTPSAADMYVFVLLGMAGGLSTYLHIEACRHAPINTLAPFEYTGLVWATMLGYVVWGDLPDAWTCAGAAAIVGSGLYVIAISRRQKS